MATIYSRIDKNGNKRYYGSIYHNCKRTPKSLGSSKQSAETLMKKLEYKLLFNVQAPFTKPQIYNYEEAILSFLKEVKRTSVKVKQISDITTKVNYFKEYCFLLALLKFDNKILLRFYINIFPIFNTFSVVPLFYYLSILGPDYIFSVMY